ncbi:glycine zipper 2TM domain-containing protein [Thermomonas sp. HDW16]|uniref:glycine zipper 2TM domain-containing protein n=1 Tax=Thermomonas sp. HDW16 TaxID=2714945 RepID=UPI001408EBAB|nr:glycine zipper 2TM domain-containing protein [Thermomonas sp. HDW16]QIL20471.1 glycine zipper 2TM domain-containing protein [Thermomonas sp. HDW16]
MTIRANNLRLLGIAALAAALAMGTGCASTNPGYSNGGSYGGGASANCYDCGTVTRIETGVGSRAPNATGAVVGGLIGAAAAREVAKDRTDSEGRQNTATVAGAAAGAVIGNAIQNRAGTGYNIYVRLNSGQEVVAMQDDLGPIRVGSSVRVVNGRAYQR